MPSFDSPTYGGLPMAPPPGSPNMQMSDLGVEPLPPDGVEMWGNPVLDAPAVDVDAMFPNETAPEMSLGAEACPTCGGMGCEMCGSAPAAAQMNSEQIRAAAKTALLQKAQQRMAASQGFQESAANMAKRQF